MPIWDWPMQYWIVWAKVVGLLVGIIIGVYLLLTYLGFDLSSRDGDYLYGDDEYSDCYSDD